MPDLHARQIAELHRLPGQRKGAGDHRLRGDHRGNRGEPHQRVDRPVRGKPEERVLDRRRIGEKKPPLPEVIQQQGRKDKAQPPPPDGRRPEMSHIGVQGLRPGHRQNHRAERDEGGPRLANEKRDAIGRAQRFENFRRANDRNETERRERGKPHEHDGAKKPADFRRAPRLEQEQRHEDGQRQ